MLTVLSTSVGRKFVFIVVGWKLSFCCFMCCVCELSVSRFVLYLWCDDTIKQNIVTCLLHIWKEIIFSDDSRRENKFKYFYFVYYYYFFYIIKTKIIYREIQAASGEWVNNYAHGSPRRDSLTNESAGDIIKRSIRRSWTISSKWLNCGNWWSII